VYFISAVVSISIIISVDDRHTMDERFFNFTDADDNATSSWNVSSVPREDSPVTEDQLYVCNLYNFVVTGVVQLIVSVIGLVGKSIKLSILVKVQCQVLKIDNMKRAS